MLFNSPEFLRFFIVVVIAYYTLSKSFRLQNLLILIASYFFYGCWDVRFLYLIVCSTVIDYCVGVLLDHGQMPRIRVLQVCSFAVLSCFFFVVVPWGDWFVFFEQQSSAITYVMSLYESATWPVFWLTILIIICGCLAHPYLIRLEDAKRRKCLLLISMVANLGILGFFKYFNFFAESLSDFLTLLLGWAPSDWTLNVVLPVGISFYTFQTMSYTIDVYRRKIDSSTDFVEFGAYVAFFPQLVAGPIERAEKLLPQFRGPRPTISFEAIRYGSWLFLWGLYKKVVVADQMALIVNSYFRPFDDGSSVAAPADGLQTWVVVLAFAFQIYGDFSGYSDMARGVARWMGFELMLNFNVPYLSLSPSEFWRRWHISLSTWLRDYLYISLGGNRQGAFFTYRNLFLTMLLGGFWHGASWNFVLWGVYHGILLCLYRLLGIDRILSHKISRPMSVFAWVIMTCLTLVGWMLFRSQNWTTISSLGYAMLFRITRETIALETLKTVVFYAWLLVVFQLFQRYHNDTNFLRRCHWFIRINVFVLLVMSIAAFATGKSEEFIYFAF